MNFCFPKRILRLLAAAVLLFASSVPATIAVTDGAGRVSNRPSNHTQRADMPAAQNLVPAHKLPALRLAPVAHHATRFLKENSGLGNCSKLPNAFWTIGDSGNGAYIYAIQADGKLLTRPRGILLTNRRNVDWEAIATDGEGNLVIGDIGNNESRRRNLCFYIVPEPALNAEEIALASKIGFYYPTQDFFPDPTKNYDSEACFVLNRQIYFFTKHWTNTETILWRVDPSKPEEYQAAVPVARFNVQGMVTDVALSLARDKLAILTYHNIWIFDLPPPDANGVRPETRFFASTPRFRKIVVIPHKHWQLEGIVFENADSLLLSSESGALFRVPVSEIK